MTVQTKIYPGDLPPISPGPDAMAEWQRRWEALFTYFNLDITIMHPVEAERALLCQLIEKHEPAGMKRLLLLLPTLTESGTSLLLRSLADEYLPCLSIKSQPKGGRPKGSTKKDSKRELKLFSLIHSQKPQDQYRGWGAEELIRKILREHPDLEPKSRKAEPWRAAYSEYRRYMGRTKEIDKDFVPKVQNRFPELIAACEPSTKAEFERWCALAKLTPADGDKDAERELEEKKHEAFHGVIFGSQWHSLNEQLKVALSAKNDEEVEAIKSRMDSLAPTCDGAKFLNLFMRTDTYLMIQGGE